MMSVKVEGYGERLDDPVCQFFVAAFMTADAEMNDGKLVAAEPRDCVVCLCLSFQPLANGLQKLVANGVTKGVVHILEVIEVQEKNRACSLLLRLLDGLLQLGLKQGAIRQTCKRVVVSKMIDLRCSSTLFLKNSHFYMGLLKQVPICKMAYALENKAESKDSRQKKSGGCECHLPAPQR